MTSFSSLQSTSVHMSNYTKTSGLSYLLQYQIHKERTGIILKETLNPSDNLYNNMKEQCKKKLQFRNKHERMWTQREI